jgi:hypothetical protein
MGNEKMRNANECDGNEMMEIMKMMEIKSYEMK